MTEIVYGLCAITSLICTGLLIHGYIRNGYRTLLWSAVCFTGLSLNNILLVLDKVVLPAIDLSILRTSVALLAMAILLYGLIWEAE